MTRSAADALTPDQAAALAPLITPEEAASRVAAGAVLLDVRSAAGRAEAGGLPLATVAARDHDGAVAVDATLAREGLTSPETPVVVICGSVVGSGPVAAALLARGFTDVVHVEGGFPAWAQAGLPTSPPAG